MEKEKQESVDTSEKETLYSYGGIKRPFILSILCVATFVYSAFFILIFFFGLIYNSRLTAILNDFLQEKNFSRMSIFLLSFSGVLLFSLSFLGTYFMWKLKRAGLYIYIVSTVIIIIAPYLTGFISHTNTIIFLLLIISFSLFSRRLT